MVIVSGNTTFVMGLLENAPYPIAVTFMPLIVGGIFTILSLPIYPVIVPFENLKNSSAVYI